MPDVQPSSPSDATADDFDRMLHSWQSRFTGGRSPSTVALAVMDWTGECPVQNSGSRAQHLKGTAHLRAIQRTASDGHMVRKAPWTAVGSVRSLLCSFGRYTLRDHMSRLQRAPGLFSDAARPGDAAQAKPARSAAGAASAHARDRADPNPLWLAACSDHAPARRLGGWQEADLPALIARKGLSCAASGRDGVKWPSIVKRVVSPDA
jgi:hypothetical protein